MNFNDIKDLKDLQQMLPTDPQDAEGKMRIIQELVPGKQITPVSYTHLAKPLAVDKTMRIGIVKKKNMVLSKYACFYVEVLKNHLSID